MAGEASCIFCKLASGAVPCLKVAESTEALAFLDIAPLAEGHVLLIPKRHAAVMSALTADMAAAVARLLPILSAVVQRATGAEGCNILQNNGRAAGQVVEHVHFHIIPRREGDGLGYRWLAGKYESGRAEEMHSRMRQVLGDLDRPSAAG